MMYESPYAQRMRAASQQAFLPRERSSARRKIKIDIGSVCPCGSGQAIAHCHLDPIDGRFRKNIRTLRPPRGPTGFAHERCYLNVTGDCSREISREHYISEAVLKKLGEIIAISGTHWIESGCTLQTSLASLTAKILCKRHNEALSPLDAEAGIFFKALLDGIIDLDRKTLSKKRKFHLASGEGLELWFLKVACGHYFGLAAHDGAKLKEAYEIDLTQITKAFFDREWLSRCGLYFKGSTGDRLKTSSTIGISALLDPPRKEMAGVTISLLGVEMDLIFKATNANPGEWTGLHKRPTELVLRRGARFHSIILTWPVGTPEFSVGLHAKGRRSPAA